MEGNVIRDLSSPLSSHRVYLFESQKHGRIIKKVFDHPTPFKRTVEAFKTIDRMLHPAILKIDMRRRTMYMSYDPIQTEPENMDQCAAELMKKLHTSTQRNRAPYDPGTGEAYPFWKDYLKKYGPEWVETLKSMGDYASRFHELLGSLKNSPYIPTAYIHQAIRPDNIGERKGQYILFDFEDAVWGDPYWDVARYVVESAESRSSFYKLYGVEDEERADLYIWMFALSYAAYLMENGRTDHHMFARCRTVLDGGTI